MTAAPYYCLEPGTHCGLDVGGACNGNALLCAPNLDCGYDGKCEGSVGMRGWCYNPIN
jgi:hypothetical protein